MSTSPNHRIKLCLPLLRSVSQKTCVALAMGLIMSVAISNGVAADENQPEIAFVCAEEVVIRSGPGPTYYPTLKLDRGTRVEIYRHDPGGWLAVRPPQGSFSWVKAAHIEQNTDTSIGTVTAEDTITRVGSDQGSEFDVEYIHLDVGESVEVIGGEHLPTGEDEEEELWLKIAPPAGEFRWIHTDDVAANLESALASTGAEAGADAPTSDAPSTILPQESEPAALADLLAAASPPEEILAEQENAWSDRFADIERQLNAVISGDPERWDLQPLKVQAATLSNNIPDGADAAMHNQTASLMQRIDRFIAIQDEYRRAAQPLASESGPTAEGIYDGVGYLMPAVSQRDNAPRYALTDIEGRILHLVSPAPGMNLHRYLRKEVGVVGQRGYHTELHTPHLTAERIIVLDSLR